MSISKEPKIIGIRAMPDKIVVEVAKAKETTRSGLYIPDEARDQMNQGRVYAVWDYPEQIFKKGDIVVFGKYAGTELTFSSNRGRKLLVLREADVLLIVDYEFEPEEVMTEIKGSVEDVAGPEPTEEYVDYVAGSHADQ